MGNLNVTVSLVRNSKASEAVREAIEIAKIVGKPVEINIGLGENLVVGTKSDITDCLKLIVLMSENKKLKEANEGLVNVNESLRQQIEGDLSSDDIRWRKLLQTRIENIGGFMSFYTKNALLSNGMVTVVDIFRYNETELIKLRRIGRKSLTQVVEFLDEEIENSYDRLGDPDVQKYLLAGEIS